MLKIIEVNEAQKELKTLFHSIKLKFIPRNGHGKFSFSETMSSLFIMEVI